MSWYLAADGWFASEPAGFRLRWVSFGDPLDKSVAFEVAGLSRASARRSLWTSSSNTPRVGGLL